MANHRLAYALQVLRASNAVEGCRDTIQDDTPFKTKTHIHAEFKSMKSNPSIEVTNMTDEEIRGALVTNAQQARPHSPEEATLRRPRTAGAGVQARQGDPKGITLVEEDRQKDHLLTPSGPPLFGAARCR